MSVCTCILPHQYGTGLTLSVPKLICFCRLHFHVNTDISPQTIFISNDACLLRPFVSIPTSPQTALSCWNWNAVSPQKCLYWYASSDVSYRYWHMFPPIIRINADCRVNFCVNTDIPQTIILTCLLRLYFLVNTGMSPKAFHVDTYKTPQTLILTRLINIYFWIWICVLSLDNASLLIQACLIR